MSPRFPRLPRRRRWQLLAGLVVVAVLAAVIAAFALTREQDVSNPSVEFRSEPTDTVEPPPPPTDAPTAAKAHERFIWPVYGYTKDRRRYLPGPSLRPPYARLWNVRARALLEFSPVIGPRWLYLLDNNAFPWSIRKRNGDVRWKRRLGILAAASPAYDHGRVFVTVLERAPRKGGRVVALRARDGKVLWKRELAARAESSPLVDGGRVYFGSEDGTVYAL